MSFLNKIFGGSSTENVSEANWTALETMADLEAAVQQSDAQTVAIFKHSTRCFISKTVLKNFEREIADRKPAATLYFLDLLEHRDISNEIAERFDITHQSPQLIVLQKGHAVRHASHQDITASLL